MKSLILAALLLLTTAVVHAQDDYENNDTDHDGMMTQKQAEYLRYNGVSVHIIRVDDRLISRRARAYYEAGLTNPYSRAIRCTIELISSRGVNERYEVIDSKSHIGVYVPARSITKVCGNLEIKHGRGDDGLQWLESKGHLVSARNCMFVE